MAAGWQTCPRCGAYDKRGAHAECDGMPSHWLPCEDCGVWDDLESHYCR